MDHLNRRDFVRKAGLGAAGTGILAGCGSTDAQSGAGDGETSGPRVSWRMATSFPPSVDILHGAALLVAERVEALTGGRFTIRVFPPGELVPALQVMDGVQSGTVHAGHTSDYCYIGKHPALAFGTSIPFGLNVRQQTAWLHFGGGLDMLRDVYADFGMTSIPCGNTGAQFGGWFRRPIETLADLRGVRMRIPGLAGEIMARLGVTVHVLGGPDVFPALERGAIDAAEWVGPYDDEKLGFHEVAKNYYVPGWWEPGPSTVLQIGLDAWNALPPPYQAALESAAERQAGVAARVTGDGVERTNDHHDQSDPLDGRSDPVVQPVDRGRDPLERPHALGRLRSPEVLPRLAQLSEDGPADLQQGFNAVHVVRQ